MRAAALVLLFSSAGVGMAMAQARDGMLSDREVEALRDTAASPADRLKAYQQFLDDRNKQLEKLNAGRHGSDYASETHDVLEQMAGIADELNDNLDDWERHQRDVRKPLPKLRDATERWSTTLRAPAADKRYDVVRREAADAIADMRAQAEKMIAEQAAYFKEHPEAAAQEKRRREDPHAPE